MVKKADMVGSFELEDGSILSVVRKATGRDLMNAMKAQQENGDFISTLVARVCHLNDAPLTSAQVEEFESGVSLAVQEVAFDAKKLIPVEVDSYPKVYDLDGKKVELLESRKIKHDNKATRYSNGNTHEMTFWLMSFLIRIDDKAARYDDLLDMSGGEVQALMTLVTPKKPSFVPVKM